MLMIVKRLSVLLVLCLYVDFTCSPGEFLDISTDQECHPCPAGTFSFGDGVLFKDWKQLPAGFSVSLHSFMSRSDLHSQTDDGRNMCSG